VMEWWDDGAAIYLSGPLANATFHIPKASAYHLDNQLHFDRADL